ncbi:MAG: hypothetical protein IAF58_07815 [Leptolyngbya sp.]|nr:hypothetical protein [Candidatus Melainabacteria bacterium]
MSEDYSSIESSLAQLSKRIDEQARFTRSVVIICTLTVLGVVFYTMTEVFSSLPANILLHFMGNMEKVYHEWKLFDSSDSKNRRILLPPPAKPAPTATSGAPKP